MEAHEVRNLDREIEQAKHCIEMHEALVRLEKNRDFKKVITEGFLKDFVLHNVATRARYEFRKDEALLKSNQLKIEAAAELTEFLRIVHTMGMNSMDKLQQAEALKHSIEMED